ncbi:hypothetical protein EIP91_006879 [Steccherinum ochraceum]|uniref:Uncharacterized protein n=1 Tax=Steccherinum ochraceum TaxID=92696 RepID=A0A4R0R568_9APHY|nr:hypothetical protein EIP91_006879 [Steccherinum ochraceum]
MPSALYISASWFLDINARWFASLPNLRPSVSPSGPLTSSLLGMVQRNVKAKKPASSLSLVCRSSATVQNKADDHPQVPHLPSEVWSMVFEAVLGSPGDYKQTSQDILTLVTCCLTCRSWRRQAERPLKKFRPRSDVTISNATELIVIPLSHCHVIERLAIRPHSLFDQGWVTASLRTLTPRLTKLRRLEVGDLDLDAQHVDFFQAWSLLRDLDTKFILIDRIRFTKPSHLERLATHLSGKHVDIVNPNPSPGIGVFYMPTDPSPITPSHDTSGMVNLHVPWCALASKLDGCCLRVSVLRLFHADSTLIPHLVELRCVAIASVSYYRGTELIRVLTFTSPRQAPNSGGTSRNIFSAPSLSPTLNYRTRANAFPEIVRLSVGVSSNLTKGPSSVSATLSRPVLPLYSFCFNKARAVELWTAFDDALVTSRICGSVGSVEFDVEDTPAVLPTYFDTWTEKMDNVVDMTKDLSLLLPRLVRSEASASRPLLLPPR